MRRSSDEKAERPRSGRRCLDLSDLRCERGRGPRGRGGGGAAFGDGGRGHDAVDRQVGASMRGSRAAAERMAALACASWRTRPRPRPRTGVGACRRARPGASARTRVRVGASGGGAQDRAHARLPRSPSEGSTSRTGTHAAVALPCAPRRRSGGVGGACACAHATHVPAAPQPAGPAERERFIFCLGHAACAPSWPRSAPGRGFHGGPRASHPPAAGPGHLDLADTTHRHASVIPLAPAENVRPGVRSTARTRPWRPSRRAWRRAQRPVSYLEQPTRRFRT